MISQETFNIKTILKKKHSSKRHGIAKQYWKRNKVQSLILPDLKTYYKGTVIKTVSYWQKDRYINQEIEEKLQR